jgi:hypothetical protein
MSGLYRWLERQAVRQARQPDLVSALLRGRGAAYARHRLSPSVLRLIVKTGLHALEIALLTRALPLAFLAPLLAYRGWCSLASSVHWGALEGLRKDVRTRMHTRDVAGARAAIERFLGATAIMAALPVLVFAGSISFAAISGEGGISLFDCYGLACSLRLFAELRARTLHAGVFALRRVYRAWGSWLAADIVELGLLGVCFGQFSVLGIPLAILGAGLLEAAITVHYARRAYASLRLPWPRSLRRISWRWPTFEALRRALLHALANAGMQLDALLLLLLLRVDPPQRGGASLAVIYYVLRPLLGLSASWVRAFYFDMSRLETGVLAAFRPHLSRYLRAVGLVSASLCALLFFASVAWLWPAALPAALWFGPFLLARALFAQLQLEAFVRGAQPRLLAVSLLCAGPLGLCALVVHSGVTLLNVATLLLLAAGFGLRLTAAGPTAQEQPGQVGLAEWLAALARRRDTRLSVLAISRDSARPDHVAEQLQRALPSARITRWARAHVLVSAPANELTSQAQLIAALGGVAREIWLSPPGRGDEGFRLAQAQGALPPELAAALTAPRIDTRALIANFRQRYPAGRTIDTLRGLGRLPEPLLARAQLPAFARFVALACRQRESRSPGTLPIELAVFAPEGRCELIFVVARGSADFAAFRARVRLATLQASLLGRTRAAISLPSENRTQCASGLTARIERSPEP